MNKIIALIIIWSTLLSCESDTGDIVTSQTNITLNFSHSWDGTPVADSDFNTIKFTNAKGDNLSIERLRYLVSKVTFTTTNNEVLKLPGYNLVDVTNNTNLSFTPSSKIPSGNYSNVSFTFGFDNEDNYVENGYTDLNAANFSVPAMLGGGYHYMQFDGKFINASNQEQGFNYHAIRAVDNPGDNPTFPKDTFFEVNLGPINITNNTVLNIEMNIAEWFKTPNEWDLNTLNQALMPNSSAQIMMFENGQNVFSLTSID
ncbi:MbnP family protein [Hyunsoonleella ulvae]|uniref:MbnP family protein n=1 Tax=Hyunsoonleella ulvae TaxID=2799948 RepID=UPI00193997F9|nr:MbnP family protein [Hyunsoonleella ulvae]